MNLLKVSFLLMSAVLNSCATSIFSSLPNTSTSKKTNPSIYLKNQTVVAKQSDLLKEVTRSKLLDLLDGFRVMPYTHAYVDLEKFDSFRENAVKEGKSQSEIESLIELERKKLKSRYRLDIDSCFLVEFHAGSLAAMEGGGNPKYWGVELNAFLGGETSSKVLAIEFDDLVFKSSTIQRNRYGVEIYQSDDFKLFKGRICAGEKIDYNKEFSLNFTPRYSINSKTGKPTVSPFKLEWLPDTSLN